MRIHLFIVRKEGGIGEVLEAGGIIAHDIGRSWDVPGLVAVAVLALVKSSDVAELCGRTIIRDGAFVNTGPRRCVVGQVPQGGVGSVMGGAHETCLGDQGTVLQITVGDGAVGVGRADDLGLDVLREGKSPDEGVTVCVEVDAAHTRLGRIGGAQERGFLGHDLGEVGRTVAETGGEDGEGIDMGPKGLGDADAVTVGLLEGQLESREQSSRARDGHRDESELAQDALPVLVADAVSPGEFVEDASEAFLAVRGKFDGLADGVDDPAKDELASGPAAISLEHLLQGDGLVPVLLVNSRLGEDFVEGV